MKKIYPLTILIILFFIQATLFSNIIYVNVNATGNNDGTSWGDAYTSLQDALDNAASEDSIWVARGVYVPTKDGTGDPNPGNPAYKHFEINKALHLYGGFTGVETVLEERDLEVNPTILSGDLQQNDINTDGNNIIESPADIVGINCIRIMKFGTNGKEFTIDGFIFTGSTAPNEEEGSGILFLGLFTNKTATIRNCRFHGIQATRGAAIAVVGFVPYTTTLNIENCTFSGNSATDKASAIYADGWTGTVLMTVDRCIFENNQGGLGTIYNLGGPPAQQYIRVNNSVFRNNQTSSQGGALFLSGIGIQEFNNCTFVGNSANLGGGAIRLDNVTPKTFMKNCIFHDNTSNIPGEENLSGQLSEFRIGWSLLSDTECLPDMICEDGMIFGEDPLFVDSPNDLRLTENSPCVDTGTGENAPVVDLDGNDRPSPGTAPDMGAYEWYFVNSTDRIESENLSVFAFPNPTTDKVFIKIDSDQPQNFDLTLINMSGQKVLFSEISNSENQRSLSLENIPTGAYWLRVEDENGALGTIKLMKF